MKGMLLSLCEEIKSSHVVRQSRLVRQPSLGWLITPVGKDWVSLSTQSYLYQHRPVFLSQATITFDTLAYLGKAEKEQMSGDLELTQTLKGREV